MVRLGARLLADGGWRGARRVGIRDAWLAPERYADATIAVVGEVRAFEAGTPGVYYTLDEGAARIGLRGEAVSSWVGQRVRVSGKLTFKPGVGIFLDAERIAAAR